VNEVTVSEIIANQVCLDVVGGIQTSKVSEMQFFIGGSNKSGGRSRREFKNDSEAKNEGRQGRKNRSGRTRAGNGNRQDMRDRRNEKGCGRNSANDLEIVAAN